MATNPAAALISLEAAKVPDTYKDKDLSFIADVLRIHLASQMHSHEDIKGILKALSHGPFLTSISSTKPHPDQRPIDGSHIPQLTETLLGEDMRLAYPCFIVVPTNEWLNHPSPDLDPNPSISSIPIWNPSKAITLTHGHRFHALQVGLQGSKAKEIQTMYGKNQGKDLLWVTLTIPDMLFEILPPLFFPIYILKDNMGDKFLLQLSDEQCTVTWIAYLCHMYKITYYPQGQFQPIPSNDPRLAAILSNSRKDYLAGSYTRIDGLYTLWHPTLLPTLGEAMVTTFGKTFFRLSILQELANCNIWPMCAALQAGHLQLAPLAQASWRKGLAMERPNKGSSKVIKLGVRSNYAFRLNDLHTLVSQGYVFNWLLESMPYKRALQESQAILDQLEFADSEALSPPLKALLDSYHISARQSFSFRLMHASSEPQWLLWPGLLTSAKDIKYRQRFLNLVNVIHVLVWLLMGPDIANNLNNKRSAINQPFGHIMWWKCPDGIILAYLALARMATPQQLFPPLLPVSTTVQELYAQAPEEDIIKLNKLASVFMDQYEILQEEVFLNLRHLRTGFQLPPDEDQVHYHPSVNSIQPNPLFFWNTHHAACHKFVGDQLTPPVNMETTVGRCSPLEVIYGPVPQGLEEQSAAKYAEAVEYLMGHETWQYILFDVLQSSPAPSTPAPATSQKSSSEDDSSSQSSSSPGSGSSPFVPLRLRKGTQNSSPRNTPSPSPSNQQAMSHPTTPRTPQGNPNSEDLDTPRPQQSSSLSKGKRRAAPPEEARASKHARTSSDSDSEDNLNQMGYANWDLVHSQKMSESQWRKEMEINQMLLESIDSTPRQEGQWIKPLKDSSIPASIPPPTHPLWHQQSKVERETAMHLYMQHFPSDTHSYLQAGFFQVMRLFEHVGKEFGDNSAAFNYALRDLENKVGSMCGRATQRHGGWGQIPEDEVVEEEDEQEMIVDE
ncbi:hypothetical protein BV20DRAFT_983880 [Pilatotrama ljubarskyi]|nr:hypothetical protein BV20DRAFT_983880 [Pilatotrama ljubarskyi]